MGIEIKKGPAPKVKRRLGPPTKYPFAQLLIGKHFVMPKKDNPNINSIRSCAVAAQNRLGMKFSVAEQDNGDVTVERIK